MLLEMISEMAERINALGRAIPAQVTTSSLKDSAAVIIAEVATNSTLIQISLNILSCSPQPSDQSSSSKHMASATRGTVPGIMTTKVSVSGRLSILKNEVSKLRPTGSTNHASRTRDKIIERSEQELETRIQNLENAWPDVSDIAVYWSEVKNMETMFKDLESRSLFAQTACAKVDSFVATNRWWDLRTTLKPRDDLRKEIERLRRLEQENSDAMKEQIRDLERKTGELAAKSLLLDEKLAAQGLKPKLMPTRKSARNGAAC
ncbi:hypothetical protein DL98DRAFT_566366 [Cadophora sp. DSE1049]|nr:hypothetical protein DL98DRAFT_566366 [Cadophora sp. DSE1049]